MQQYDLLTSHNLNQIKQVMDQHEEISTRLQLKETKQNQHIEGTNSPGKSYFQGTNSNEIYKHTLQNMDMTKMFQQYQYIPLDKFNGKVINADGSLLGNAMKFKVHQGKKGIHSVPHRKKE